MKNKNEIILENIDEYVVVQASKLMSLYLHSTHMFLDNLEVDELVQRVRIKLWKKMEKEPVLHPFSYVKRVIYSEFIDMRRQQKTLLPLLGEEDYQNLGEEDPTNEVIERIDSTLFLHCIARMIVDLPPRQRLAMVCLIQEHVDDVTQLRAIFNQYNINTDEAHWPESKTERRLLLASLSVARQKLVKERSNNVANSPFAQMYSYL